MSQPSPQLVVVFGEALIDCFPDGGRVLGGAPFNVAWHLRGFGLAPLFITAVGDDADGDRLLDAMRAWDMDTSGIQRHAAHPTGRVEVTLQQGQPRFEILADQAYDHIDARRAVATVPAGAAGILYHGTLAARAAESRQALTAVRARPGLRAFVDVNLRSPWWSRDLVERLIAEAAWVKLNEDEFATLNTVGGADGGVLADRVAAWRRQGGHQGVWLTRGAAGALLADAEGVASQPTPQLTRIQDTVGAGDAFSAVVITGLLLGWTRQKILSSALEFAARVCEQTGAISEDRALYRDFNAS